MQYFPTPTVYYATPQQAAAAQAAHTQPVSHMQLQQQQPPQQPTLATFSHQPMGHAYQAAPAGMMAYQPSQLQSAMQQHLQQQPHQQQQQQQHAAMSYAPPLLHYAPPAGSPPYGYYASSPVPSAGQPGMAAAQRMYGVVPAHLQHMYANQTAQAQMGFAPNQTQPVLPTFTPVHATQAVHRPAAMQAATVQHAAPSTQPQQQSHQPPLVPRVAAVVAVPSQPPTSLASFQAATAAPAQAPPAAVSSTSTAAASIAAGMQPAAAIPALRSTFSAAGHPIPAHFRPQPPMHTTSMPPLTNVSSSSSTPSLSPLADVATSASTATPSLGHAASLPVGRENRGAMREADTSSDSLVPTRRPALLHSRSAMVPSSSAASRSSGIALPLPALTSQRSLPVVGSAGVQWRSTVVAAERSRISDKLGVQLAACQLDLEQLLTLAACMAEESLYERAESRLDYLKLSIQMQHNIASLPLPTQRPPAPTAPAAADTIDADVTGLLALAQSSVEQKQSELGEWGQKSTEDDEGATHGLGEEIRRRKRDRTGTATGMTD